MKIPRSDTGMRKAIAQLFGDERGVNDPLIFIRRQRQRTKLPTTWRRAMHINLFEPCQVPLGDKRVRGQEITCGRCGSHGRVPLATMPHSTGNDDRQVQLLTTRKFSNMGWLIGKTTSRHRCPTCQAATKPFAEALAPLNGNSHHHEATTEDKMSMIKSAAAPGTNGASKPTPAAVAPEVREMSREDRRVIFAKLQDVYEVKNGYVGDWSDKRVAEDMGVPRAWISTVREEFFGPDHNAEFEQQITAAKSVIADIKTLQVHLAAISAEQGKLSARIAPLLNLADHTEKTIAMIAKKTQP